MEHKPPESAGSWRARNLVLAFTVLGVIVPIVLYPFLSYSEPLSRTYSPSNLERSIWSAAPYLWPAAPVAPGRQGNIRDLDRFVGNISGLECAYIWVGGLESLAFRETRCQTQDEVPTGLIGTTATANSLTVTAPTGATTGLISVTVGNSN